MLLSRLITGLVTLPVVFATFFMAAPPFRFLIILVSAVLSVSEAGLIAEAWSGKRSRGSVPTWWAKGNVAIIATSLCAFFISSSVLWGMASALLGMLAYFAAMLRFCKRTEQAIGLAIISAFVFFYAGLPWIIIWDLVIAAPHSQQLLYLLFVVMGADTSAYFAGRFFGRRKLAPTLSPKKSWEGAIGGVVFGVAAGCLVRLMFPDLGSWTRIILIGTTAASFSIVGDLFESALKRVTGIKDSGTVLPGHGGYLDRVDSIIFAAPIVWFGFNLW